MVAEWKRAKTDPLYAARTLTALFGHDDPTVDQQVGALLSAEFMIRVIGFFAPNKG